VTDAFQNPHPEVPFASVGDDTVKALADLAAIFKLKLQQAPSPVTQASPATIIQRPNLIPFPTPKLDLAHARQAVIRLAQPHTPDVLVVEET
jgi:hypothetical protein